LWRRHVCVEDDCALLALVLMLALMLSLMLVVMLALTLALMLALVLMLALALALTLVLMLTLAPTLMLALALTLMLALALMPALMLALTLVIVASASKCGDEPIFLYFEKRTARKPDKNASMDINSYRKKKFRILAPFLCSSTYFVQTYYFLHLKKIGNEFG
jgi:hypothetical protein